MPDYKAPLRDIHFVMNDLLDSEAHYASLNGCEEVTQELASAIIHEGARFAENTVLPMFRSSDEEGCKFENGKVTRIFGSYQDINTRKLAELNQLKLLAHSKYMNLTHNLTRVN